MSSTAFSAPSASPHRCVHCQNTPWNGHDLSQEIQAIHTILASILHVGNIEFDTEINSNELAAVLAEEACMTCLCLEAVVTHAQESVLWVCALLKVDFEEMCEALLTNVISTVGRSSIRLRRCTHHCLKAGETFVRRNTAVQATDARDALAKVSSCVY